MDANWITFSTGGTILVDTSIPETKQIKITFDLGLVENYITFAISTDFENICGISASSVSGGDQEYFVGSTVTSGTTLVQNVVDELTETLDGPIPCPVTYSLETENGAYSTDILDLTSLPDIRLKNTEVGYTRVRVNIEAPNGIVVTFP